MKNFELVTTKTAENYGVAFLDTERDFLMRHFDGFKKHDAREIERFCNVVFGKIQGEPFEDKNYAKVIQVGEKFYVMKNFECVDGDTLSFSSHSFLNEIAACRCAAILELLLDGVQDVSDGDCDEND